MTRIDLDELTAPAAAVADWLAEVLDRRSLPGNLREAARYALLGPGKRLRPLLVMRCCEAVGGDGDQAVPAAGAIEMIHCFSLVHDDLPAMDDDDLRRGRPTLHRHTNDAMAILAGDLLNTLAFEILAESYGRHNPQLASGLVLELATATNNMIAGQVYDTLPDFPEEMSGIERLRTIHRHKTGALIRCACRMGAIVGGADESQLDAITRHGEAIGLMFQIVDDLLDVTKTTEEIGKATNKDAEAGKLTYPVLLGIDQTKEQAREQHAIALEALEPLGEAATPLRQLCDYMVARQK